MNGCGVADLQSIMDVEIPHSYIATSTSFPLDFNSNHMLLTLWVLFFSPECCKEVMCKCSGPAYLCAKLNNNREKCFMGSGSEINLTSSVINVQ